MKSWLFRNYKHIGLWVVLIIYFFTANQIYVSLFVKNGKPVSTDDPLPAENSGIQYKLADLLQPAVVNGQSLFELKGYAYDPADPERPDTIQVVLSSAEQSFTFSTRPVAIPNLIESVHGYTPGMAADEFSLLLSNQAVKPGLYQIGILLQPNSGSHATYVLTGSKILKRPTR